MDDKQFDKLFRRELQKNELPVPESLWDRVEEELEKEEKKKGFIWWPIGVAASIVLMFGLFWPMWNTQGPAGNGPAIPVEDQNPFMNPPQPSTGINVPGEAAMFREEEPAKRVAERTADILSKDTYWVRILQPDEEEDRRNLTRNEILTAELKMPSKPSYLKVEFASAEELIPALPDEPAAPYDEKLKEYAWSSLNSIISGDSIAPIPSPEKNPIKRIEKGWNEVLAFQKDLFSKDSKRNLQP